MYWDWTRDVGDLEHSKIWDDFQYALGGLGDPAQSYFVMSGGFKSIQLAYPTPHRLKRQLTIKSEDGAVFNTSFTKNKVEEALACGDGDLECFQSKIEEVDGAVESIIGGDLASYFSPNDPLFYLHHASIDRIWWLWQNKSPKNANALDGGLEATKIPSDGLYEEWQIGDVLDTQNGKLCYIYY
ncbi:hypothetical protein FRC03_005338 [Tulasnella sp. 419]|nr:hypothetical protein FRC03_005338 [Tulasnella sp. 419]